MPTNKQDKMDSSCQRGTFPSQRGTYPSRNMDSSCPHGTYPSRGFSSDNSTKFPPGCRGNSLKSSPGCPISYKIPEPGSYSKRSINSLKSSRRQSSYNEKDSVMVSSGLTAVGILWACLSFLATCASCIGYMLPYWIQGSMLNNTQDIYFGVFRRCNYPSISGFISQCGRYRTFEDIPSLSWQICTIVIGVGCVLAMFVSFTAIVACCMKDLVTKRVGRFAGGLQFIAALCIGAGCLLYPLGWDHAHVKQVCGESAGVYRIGDCSVGYGYFTTIGSCGLLILSSLLSWKAGTSKTDAYGIVGQYHARRI